MKLGLCGLLVIILFCPKQAASQYEFRNLNQLLNLHEDAQIYSDTGAFHGSIRPFRKLSSTKIKVNDKPLISWRNRKAWHEDLVSKETEKYAITINPLVNFQIGYEADQDLRYVNTRGYSIEGRIGKKITFVSNFQENQALFADYMMSYGRIRRAVPGQSSLVRDFGEKAFDYTFFTGEVSYVANEFFTFTVGQGRNFFGEGYRSMLLSDASFSYPFFRIETEVWRFKYINLWAQLYDARKEAQVYNGVLAKKFMSAHYLSANITSNWSFAIFESIIYGDTNQLQALDVSFLNPVVFYRPVEFAVGSNSGNALLGANTSYRFSEGRMLYSQFLLDEFSLSAIIENSGSWVNKFAWQIGYKDYDAWGVKGLFQRLEYNAARPFTYSHRAVLLNYAHYGSPLAHPWGANFHEIIFQTVYQKNRWEGDFQFNYGVLGNDINGENWGSDVYQSYLSRELELGNSIGQGNSAPYYFVNLRLAYVVNPASGLKLETGLRYRNFLPDESLGNTPMLAEESLMFIFGLRTEIFNQYYDL
jgi:hypothetical protein